MLGKVDYKAGEDKTAPSNLPGWVDFMANIPPLLSSDLIHRVVYSEVVN